MREVKDGLLLLKVVVIHAYIGRHLGKYEERKKMNTRMVWFL